jgi:uncharacterized protein (DUF342 family)
MQYTDALNNLISLGDDDMEASMYLRRKPDGTSYTMEELEALLVASGVKYGVQTEILHKIMEEGIYDQMIAVAEGKPALDGKDGEIELLFRTKLPSNPKILEDGSVDYLNIDIFEKVMKNQLIARYHKSTNGSMGYTVKGRIVLPKKGREKPAVRGKGFHISEDKEEYFSDLSGKIEFINGQIVITDLYVVNGDLNSKIGNIDFAGDIQIHGAVRAGMQVIAGGSITVNGVVEAASIKAGVNILFRAGVLGGEKCIIEAGKDIMGRFFENANIRAGGVISCNYLMNSHVIGLRGVEVHGSKSVIMGGSTEALGYVKAYCIGNDVEVPTRIKVGVDDSYLNKLKLLRRDMEQVNSEISIFNKNLRVPNVNHDKIVLGLYMKVNERLEISKKIDELESLLQKSKNAFVSATGDVHPRVSIRIDVASTIITKELRNVTFRRNGKMIAIFENR